MAGGSPANGDVVRAGRRGAAPTSGLDDARVPRACTSETAASVGLDVARVDVGVSIRVAWSFAARPVAALAGRATAPRDSTRKDVEPSPRVAPAAPGVTVSPDDGATTSGGPDAAADACDAGAATPAGPAATGATAGEAAVWVGGGAGVTADAGDDAAAGGGGDAGAGTATAADGAAVTGGAEATGAGACAGGGAGTGRGGSRPSGST